MIAADQFRAKLNDNDENNSPSNKSNARSHSKKPWLWLGVSGIALWFGQLLVSHETLQTVGLSIFSSPLALSVSPLELIAGAVAVTAKLFGC